MAVVNERGNPANPVKMSWLQGRPTDSDSGSKDIPSTRNDVSDKVCGNLFPFFFFCLFVCST